jgi:hypothetical protein
MIDLKQIVEGYYNWLSNDEDANKLAESRLLLCSVCPENLDKPEVKNSSTCSKCGCIIKAKTRVKTAKCPLNKW